MENPRGVAFCKLYDIHLLRTPPGARKAQAKRRATREHEESHFGDGSLCYFPLIIPLKRCPRPAQPGLRFCLPPDAK